MATTISIDAPAGPAEAYLARPDTDPHPGVLFFMDAIGLRPRIADMADRIAGWGYVVLAPNVFYRSGTAAETSPKGDLTQPGAREEFFAGIRPRLQGLTPDLSNPDTRVWLDTLEQHATAPVGVTGYCMGARLALRAAALAPAEVVAVGAFHGGGLVTDAADSPHTLLKDTRASYVFGHADNDPGLPPSAAATIVEELDAAGLSYRQAVYPGAAHGYTMSDTSMWDAAAAERHFSELQELLASTLG